MQLQRRFRSALAVIAVFGGLIFVPLARDAAAQDTQPTAAKAAETSTSPEDSDLKSELRELRKLVETQLGRIESQQGRIEKLESELTAAHSSTAAAPAAAAEASTAGPVTAEVKQVEQKQETLSKKVEGIESKLKGFGPFSFSGDLRLRDEPIFGGPADHSQVRNRERFRLRFNVNAKLNNNINGGFTFASGDINDPTTTNQSITGFYTRKAFALDKAFVTYNPHQFKNLTLTGGKFAYPWYNTELTWDKDLNPEGLAQTLAFNLNSVPVLKRIAFVGFELPFAEVAGVSLNNKSVVQSVTYGGQLQTTWQFAKGVKFSAYSGFYNFHNADPVALALAKANSKNPQTPLTGLLPLGTGNTVQNSIITTTATNIVTIAGTAYPTGVTSITNAQFSSKFGLFDSLARLDITTPSERWPIAFIGDYVQNTKACDNVSALQPAPANTTSVRYTQATNFPCNSRQRRGYWGEVQVGRVEQKGDWQFDYVRIFIEREAVLSNFNYSDIRQGSNVTQHRAMLLYQVNRNIQLNFTALIGRPLNFGSSNPPENWLKRFQVDAIYKF